MASNVIALFPHQECGPEGKVSAPLCQVPLSPALVVIDEQGRLRCTCGYPLLHESHDMGCPYRSYYE